MNDRDHDRALIERMRAGDTRALAELCDLYGDLLYSLALRIVGRAPDAEEQRKAAEAVPSGAKTRGAAAGALAAAGGALFFWRHKHSSEA